MFILRPTFRRMIKTAYKTGGLYLENDGEGYRIKGAYWDMWVLREKLPKEYKADIIELIGDMPSVGESGEYSSDGVQQCIPGFESSRKMSEFDGMEYFDTGVIIISPRREYLRLLQCPGIGVMLVYNNLIDGISNKNIDDENGETQVEGIFNPTDNMLVMKNNVMTFMTFAREEKCLDRFQQFMGSEDIRDLIYGMVEDDGEKEEA